MEGRVGSKLFKKKKTVINLLSAFPSPYYYLINAEIETELNFSFLFSNSNFSSNLVSLQKKKPGKKIYFNLLVADWAWHFLSLRKTFLTYILRIQTCYETRKIQMQISEISSLLGIRILLLETITGIDFLTLRGKGIVRQGGADSHNQGNAVVTPSAALCSFNAEVTSLF